MPIIMDKKQSFHPGDKTWVASVSRQMPQHAVVFEDDGDTGYFYACRAPVESGQICDAVHIYDVANVTDRHKQSELKIGWSPPGTHVLLMINDYPHAVFDFENKRGCCRDDFPPPGDGWSGHAWDEGMLEAFKQEDA